MEKKSSGVKPASSAPRKGYYDYVDTFKSEISKVTWTSAEELRAYTKIVVGATFVFGMGIYFADVCIQGGLTVLGYLMRLITA